MTELAVSLVILAMIGSLTFLTWAVAVYPFGWVLVGVVTTVQVTLVSLAIWPQRGG